MPEELGLQALIRRLTDAERLFWSDDRNMDVARAYMHGLPMRRPMSSLPNYTDEKKYWAYPKGVMPWSIEAAMEAGVLDDEDHPDIYRYKKKIVPWQGRQLFQRGRELGIFDEHGRTPVPQGPLDGPVTEWTRPPPALGTESPELPPSRKPKSLMERFLRQ